jgi:hypothetical protein
VIVVDSSRPVTQNHPENLRSACAPRRHAELTPTTLHPNGRLECKHKVTVVGRLNWQDGEPGFELAGTRALRIATLLNSQDSAVTGCSLLPASRALTGPALGFTLSSASAAVG